MGHLPLFLNRIDDTVDRPFEKGGDVFTRKFQLSESNVTCCVVVARGAELDVLRLGRTAKANLGRLIKAANDVVQVIDKVGILKKL